MSLGSIRKSVTPKVKCQLLIQKEPTPSFLDYLTLRSSAILLPPPFCNFSSHKSLSTSSRPLSLGLPTYLLLSGLLSKIFLVTLVCSTMVTCPSHSSPMHLMPTAGSKVLRNNFCNFFLTVWLVPSLQTPCSVTGIQAFLKMLHPHTLNIT